MRNLTAHCREAGSTLIATMIFALVLTTLLGTALTLSVHSYQLTTRNAMLTRALFLAEAGADEALWAVNRLQSGADWFAEGWVITSDGQYLRKVIPMHNEPLKMDEVGGRAFVRILVEVGGPGTGTVAVHSEGVILMDDGSESISQVVSMRASIQSPFIGLIAKDTLSFSGQPRFDSYNSNIFPHSYTFGVNSGEQVTVGSISSASGSVGLSNAKVFGNVVSGASDPLGSGAVTAGPGAQVTGSYIGDFDQDFPPVTVPDTTGWPNSF